MSDPNLKAALAGSLEIANADPDSPLAQATTDSADFLLDEINQALVEGMPEKITDEKLLQLVNVYRAQAYKWSQEEQVKKTTRAKKKAATAPIEIDLLS